MPSEPLVSPKRIACYEAVVPKIEVEVGDGWVERDGAWRFERQTAGGVERLHLVLPAGERATVRKLAELLEPPIQVLYILHTPRGEGVAGRYQSPKLTAGGFVAFLDEFDEFLSSDARSDCWFRSAAGDYFIVLDRHNDVFLYGNLALFADRLQEMGYEEGHIEPLSAHRHWYRDEFDHSAAAMLRAFDWQVSELRPEDEQLHSASA